MKFLREMVNFFLAGKGTLFGGKRYTFWREKVHFLAGKCEILAELWREKDIFSREKANFVQINGDFYEWLLFLT